MFGNLLICLYVCRQANVNRQQAKVFAENRTSRASRPSLSISRYTQKCIILHHKCQCFKHFGVLMTKKRLFSQLLNKAVSMALWTKAITCDKAGFKSRFCQEHQAGKNIISVNPVIMSNFSSCFCAFLWLKNPYIQRNPWLINNLRACKVLYNCRETITDVMSPLQISLFCSNKPNFRKSQISVSPVNTMDYDKKTLGERGKNKPNTNPIQTQSKPKQTQIKPNTKPNKPNSNLNSKDLRSPICPGNLIINRMNRIYCVCGLTESFDSAKMALYKGNWNLKKGRKKKLNLLKYKGLNGPGRMRALTGTLFAHSYLAHLYLLIDDRVQRKELNHG